MRRIHFQVVVPVPVYMKVYFFHVNNPDEVVDGARPVLDERGPYSWKEYREKIDISEAQQYDKGHIRYTG
jgi:hypothetical protein